MQASTPPSTDTSRAISEPQYPPLELVTRPNLTTAETAYYLNRRPQTLRGWACRSGTGPMVPKRIGGILAWPTATVKAIAGLA